VSGWSFFRGSWRSVTDRKGAAAKGLSKCHTRYLLQQAYEKGLKALGIAMLSPKLLADKQFTSVLGDYFLHHHTPMTVLSESGDEDTVAELKRAFPKDWERLLKQLKTFRIELKRRLLDDSDDSLRRAWEKVDATRPSKDPTIVSYRYPFFDGDEQVAPASWQDWDDYQGPEATVGGAVDELLKRAGHAVTIAQRQR
jgi:hypothetical protein